MQVLVGCRLQFFVRLPCGCDATCFVFLSLVATSSRRCSTALTQHERHRRYRRVSFEVMCGEVKTSRQRALTSIRSYLCWTAGVASPKHSQTPVLLRRLDRSLPAVTHRHHTDPHKPYRVGDIFPYVAARAEAFPPGIRGRRGGKLRLHGRHIFRPHGSHQHD